MTTVILATGNTAATSADIVLAAGEVANIVALIPVDYIGPQDRAILEIQWKRADGLYQGLEQLTTNIGQRSVKLSDAGTYRIARLAQANSIGAERG